MEIYQSAKMPSTGKSCSQNCCCRGLDGSSEQQYCDTIQRVWGIYQGFI